MLEDLHRFHDGLPPRKKGPSYHFDGPYLGHLILPPSMGELESQTLDEPLQYEDLEVKEPLKPSR